mmetsp:Transcript_8363/g.23979  ORF Transcript_8363/g.23979 Transcript_8363/m.23979 type:complete len:100 (+) Transcript_8363:280-579(+)
MRYCVSRSSVSVPEAIRRSMVERARPRETASGDSTVAGSCAGSPMSTARLGGLRETVPSRAWPHIGGHGGDLPELIKRLERLQEGGLRRAVATLQQDLA